MEHIRNLNLVLPLKFGTFSLFVVCLLMIVTFTAPGLCLKVTHSITVPWKPTEGIEIYRGYRQENTHECVDTASPSFLTISMNGIKKKTFFFAMKVCICARIYTEIIQRKRLRGNASIWSLLPLALMTERNNGFFM